MQLLVARAGRAQRELSDSVAGEARVRVAVHEPGDRTQASPVELEDVARECPEVGHAAGRNDHAALGEHERVLDELDLAELAPAQGRCAASMGDELREIADEQALGGRLAWLGGRHLALGAIGGSSPCRAAASTASG